MKKNRHQGAGQLYVQLHNWMQKEPAWLDLSWGAQSLYLTVKAHYNGHNNGQFFLGVRTAAREMNAARSSVERWFRELQAKGFLRQTKSAYLGVNGNGSATYWRLTEIGYMGQQATKEFKDWKPVQKTKPRTEKRGKSSRGSGRGSPEKRDDRPDNDDGFDPNLPSDRPDNQCISNIPGRGGVILFLNHLRHLQKSRRSWIDAP